MADGYSKVHGNSFAIIDSFWQYGSPMGSCLRCNWRNIDLRLGAFFNTTRRKTKERRIVWEQ